MKRRVTLKNKTVPGFEDLMAGSVSSPNPSKDLNNMLEALSCPDFRGAAQLNML